MCRARQAASCASRHLIDALPADLDLAARRPVEAPEQVQQRRLARSGRPHQREEVAARDVEAESLQHVDPLAPSAELLVQLANPHQNAVGRRGTAHTRSHGSADNDPAAVRQFGRPLDDDAFARGEAAHDLDLVPARLADPDGAALHPILDDDEHDGLALVRPDRGPGRA